MEHAVGRVVYRMMYPGERPYDPDRDADPFGYSVAGAAIGLVVGLGFILFFFIATHA